MNTFTPGIHQGIPAAEYHALPYVSNSARKAFREQGPRKWKFNQDHGISIEPTKAMQLGTAVHACTLEPDLWKEGVSHWAAPSCPSYYSTSGAWNSVKKAKDWVADKLAESNLPIFTPTEMRNIVGAANALRTHEASGPILNGQGIAEVVIFADHPLTGLQLKARTDWQMTDAQDRAWILDIKTTADLRTLPATIRDREYDFQDAFYRMMLELHGVPGAGFLFAGIELEPPYEIRVISLEDDDVEAARQWVEEDLIRLAECMEKNDWPSRYPLVERVKVPKRWIA